jgi:hypothetical protein
VRAQLRAYRLRHDRFKAGTPGLHAMGSNVEASERDTSPPPNLFRRFENGAFLHNSALNRRGTRRMDTRRHSLSE